MTPRLNYWNIATVGLSQVGIVVASVLGTGVVVRTWTEFSMVLSRPTQWMDNYGPYLLLAPILWITVAMILMFRHRNCDAPEAVAYLSGWALLIVLLIVGLNAAVIPWATLCGLSLSA